MTEMLNLINVDELIQVTKDIPLKKSFFRDRYFPTGPEDIQRSNHLFCAHQDSDQELAPFVADHVRDIPLQRKGYEISKYTPATISPSMVLTLDDLEAEGIIENFYLGLTPAQRAIEFIKRDMEKLDESITLSEEWLVIQTMMNNAVDIPEQIDGDTYAAPKRIQFYEGTPDHIYTVANKWDSPLGDIYSDIVEMCNMLLVRGLYPRDLILGKDVVSAFRKNDDLRTMLDTSSGIHVGELRAELTEYGGVSLWGVMNFGGFMLNVINASETYQTSGGKQVPYFPSKGVMVTYPSCGRMKYAHVKYLNPHTDNFESIADRRVPQVLTNPHTNVRKLILTSRVLALPHERSPYVYAADVVG